MNRKKVHDYKKKHNLSFWLAEQMLQKLSDDDETKNTGNTRRRSRRM